ncbi:Ankyrin repeat domain-containing protein 50 [Colletotrichum fructicola Nara gc5]|uniref:Ankyrin repeat domain-containing protein 50 n=1 Tax=Colletotrichum fructicola (strain Nara gc5) TaxID=1213859 RepID=A0A7J6ITN2_COLFN|nr:Ankyrin repeat domain-containing protein 50 [Colletotrichum fructicola Nara gc5]
MTDTSAKKRKNDEEDDQRGHPKNRRVEATHTHRSYTVGWVCALPKEQTAAVAMLDEEHPSLPNPSGDPNAYTLGSIGGHNVVVACLPMGQIGTVSAATVATHMVQTFPSMKFGLMVGIGGGVPYKENDVRLGDVVISSPSGQFPGVVQWDMGKTKEGGKFERTGSLNNPPASLLSALSKIKTRHSMKEPRIQEFLDEMATRWPMLAAQYLKSEEMVDVLFKSSYGHEEKPVDTESGSDDSSDEDDEECQYCDKSKVIKDAKFRDAMNKGLGGQLLCVEMEAAGLMTNFPCLVIRGICDYADSHKNKVWQEHAAAVAAAYAKELLLDHVQPAEVERERSAREQLSAQLTEVENAVTAVGEDVKQVHVKLTTAEDKKLFKDILEWLSPINYGSMQSDHFTMRHEGTGQWFLSSPQYQEWNESTGKTLYCPGIPGAGKTILTSIVINDLVSKAESNTEVGIAYVYCSFQRATEQNIEHMLSSLLKQLAERAPDPSESLRSLFEKHKHWQTRPSVAELSKTLELVCKTFARVYILIDALDECQAVGCRSSLLKTLFKQRTGTGAPVHLFATSRFIPEIEEEFEDPLRCEIKASEKDVRDYVSHHMSDFRVRIAKNPGLETEIIDGVAQAVRGMFLLARLHLGSLTNTTSVREILSALDKFKQQSANESSDHQVYDGAYDDAFARINGQESNLRHLGRNVLSWIVHAVRPLTTTELNHALAVDTNRSDTDLDRHNLRDTDTIVSVCAGLVTFDKTSDNIRLVHYTTQEYFQRTKEKYFPTAHFEMTKDVKDFLLDDTKMQALSEISVSNEFPNSGLGWAASYGLQEAIEIFRDLGHDLNAPDSFGRTPLFYAARYGRLEAIKQLCDLGACPGNPPPNGDEKAFPLVVAEFHDHPEAIRLLLEKGALIDAQGEHRRTSLALAAYSGNLSLMELLLDRRASIDAVDDQKCTPLIIAAEAGHISCVRLLLEKGARVDTLDEDGCTALAYTARLGDLDLVKMMLDKGAPIDAAEGEGSTPLQYAAEEGRTDVIKLLIQKGADIEIKGHADKNALALSATGGHSEIVKALLDARASIEVKDSASQSPLSLAARSGRPEATQILLERGADVNSTDFHERAPLSWACRHARIAPPRFLKTIQLLLEHGAQVNAKDKYGRTAVSFASSGEGTDDAVKLLIERGAEVNIEDKWGRTALTMARRYGREEAARILVEAGTVDNYIQTDESIGPKTKEFLRRYQSTHFGGPNLVTSQAMNEESPALSFSIPPQLLSDLEAA